MGNQQANDGEINNPTAYEQKQALIPENEKEDVEFKIFVGIDFGTDGCGLAYVVKNNVNYADQFEHKLYVDNENDMDNVHIHTNDMDKDFLITWGKSRTSVLLDADNNVQCVGCHATTTFVNMKNAKGWKLFERFKMNLYESPKWKSEIMSKKKNVNKVTLHGGDTFSLKYIFIYKLTKLCALALEFLKMSCMQNKFIKFKFKEQDIQWILTIPATWSDSAKNKMQQWAQDAKLIDPKIRNQLKIVYEPDCASLSVHYSCNKWDNSCYTETVETKEEIKYNALDEYNDEEMKYTAKDYTQYLEENIIKLQDKVDPEIRFNKGDIYCLVDCGADTCDIACHTTTGKYNTKEILHPTGGPWGSMNIDKRFINLLELIFGNDFINDFKSLNSGMWLQLNQNFCNDSKASFYNSNNSIKKYHHITIPANFTYIIHQEYDNEIDRINEALNNKSIELFDEDDMLKWEIGKWQDVTLQIHNKVYINYLFEPHTVTPIINHLTNVLNEHEMTNCKYIVLVGGLANSRYYQQRIYNEFGRNRNNKIKIIVPDKPQLCVVSGAARMGINPNYIQNGKLPKMERITEEKKITHNNDDLIRREQKQLLSESVIHTRNCLKSTEKLLTLANKWKSNETFQNLIVEYTTGNGTSDSSSSQISDSGESKCNGDGKKRNNCNDNRKTNDNNHNDQHEKKDDQNDDQNDNNKCIMHEYNCNVSWHAVRLKELEDENKRLKLLLQKQIEDSTTNVRESKEIETNNETKQSTVSSFPDGSATAFPKTNGINLKITKKLIKKEISNKAKGAFFNAFDCMNKYTHIYHENVIKDYKHEENDIKVINYDIQCAKTQKSLYVACEKIHQVNGGCTTWKTNDNLYTESELKAMYNISRNNLPLPAVISDQINAEITHAMQEITNILQNKKQINYIIENQKTPWNDETKIPIFNKSSKQTGLTLRLEKHEFVDRLKIFVAENCKKTHLVPIVRFNEANKYFYEIAWIVTIGKDINIAISFKHINKNKYLPSAIYLDIHDQHKLVAYRHNCECLSASKCIIDRLQIGHSTETRMHQRYKSKMEEKISEYENQMQNYLQLREQDMLVIDNIKVTCVTLQRDLQSLLQIQCSVNQQQKTCNQLHVLNTMNALTITSQQNLSNPFQVYNNQSAVQTNHQIQNQQQ